MFNKKILLLFLIILCSVTVVSANNVGLDDVDNSVIQSSSSNPVKHSVNTVKRDLFSGNSQNVTKNNDSKVNNESVNSTKKIVKFNTTETGVAKVWISYMAIKPKNKYAVSLKSNKEGIIYYTLNGSKPTVKSKKYTKPIIISEKHVLKYCLGDKKKISSKIFTYKRILGKTSKGYVEKLYYGNLSSNKTIVLIVGVHVQESGMHKAIQLSLKNKNSVLNRKFVLYYIHVTKNKNSYQKSRMNGQILANKYIIPDISNEKPDVVTDVHETRYKISGYKYPRFLHIISTNDRPGVKVSDKLYNKSVVYLNRILKLASHLKRYDPPPTGSSPRYVTIPIANKGFVSYVYETEASYKTKTKQKYADKYISTLNKVDLEI